MHPCTEVALSMSISVTSPQLNEKSDIFHGASKAVTLIICQEGFDIRVAGLGGSMGAGTYFAEVGENWVEY